MGCRFRCISLTKYFRSSQVKRLTGFVCKWYIQGMGYLVHCFASASSAIPVTKTEGVQMVHSNKQAAIYCRVSTTDQNADRQVRDLTAFAEKQGYTVVSVHIETASGTKNDRAERAKVMKLAQAGKIDVILVTEMSRWGRSTADLLSTLDTLQARKVSLIAMSGDMQFDLSTASGKLIVSILASISEFERSLLLERTMSGIANAKARGVKFGRQAGDNIVADKVQSKVVAMQAAGKSLRTIAKDLDISRTTVSKALNLANAKS